MSFETATALPLWDEDDRPGGTEDYSLASGVVQRAIKLRSGETIRSTAPLGVAPGGDAFLTYWKQWLQEESGPRCAGSAPVTVADLFSGCGGLSVGVREACRALQLEEHVALAVDMDEPALDVFKANFAPARAETRPIEELVDGTLGGRLTTAERRLRKSLDGLTLAIGGPPCQGHSDLNNHTRRHDPKNALYLRMVRFVEVVEPEHVVIENVPGVRHDRTGVVRTAIEALARLGYQVSDGLLSVESLGWAQRRKRHLCVASRSSAATVEGIATAFARPAAPVMWAIDDLERSESRALFDTSARHSPTNQRRIKYLFDNNLFELPDAERPDCHRLKPHSYASVYGRMRPDSPAPTITSGFGSTGQGRFVHPTQARTLTPHEAARLQGFPDSFDFSTCDTRRALQRMIGNAVPSRLGYVVALELLR